MKDRQIRHVQAMTESQTADKRLPASIRKGNVFYRSYFSDLTMLPLGFFGCCLAMRKKMT